MNSANTWLTIALVLCIIFSGCGTVPQGNGVDITFDGKVSGSEAGFIIEGQLISDGGMPTAESFDNVVIELYDEEQELILSHPLGRLKANGGRINVSVTHPDIPEYVIFDSPNFWTGNNQVQVFWRTETSYNYSKHHAVREDDVFPNG